MNNKIFSFWTGFTSSDTYFETKVTHSQPLYAKVTSLEKNVRVDNGHLYKNEVKEQNFEKISSQNHIISNKILKNNIAY